MPRAISNRSCTQYRPLPHVRSVGPINAQYVLAQMAATTHDAQTHLNHQFSWETHPLCSSPLFRLYRRGATSGQFRHAIPTFHFHGPSSRSFPRPVYRPPGALRCKQLLVETSMPIRGIERPVKLLTRDDTIPAGTDCSILTKHLRTINLRLAANPSSGGYLPYSI